MSVMDTVRLRSALRAVGIVAGLLLATTLLVALLEGPIGVDNAAMTYLLAVIGAAALLGGAAAAFTAVGAFIAYDVLFIEPRFTVTVEDPTTFTRPFVSTSTLAGLMSRCTTPSTWA